MYIYNNVLRCWIFLHCTFFYCNFFFFTVILYNLIVTLCEGGFEPWRKGLSYMPLGGIKVLHVCYLWRKLHFTIINYTSIYTLYTKFLECTVCTSVFDRTSNLQFTNFNQQVGLWKLWRSCVKNSLRLYGLGK